MSCTFSAVEFFSALIVVVAISLGLPSPLVEDFLLNLESSCRIVSRTHYAQNIVSHFLIDYII